MARYSLGFASVTTTSGGKADTTSYVSAGYPFYLQGGSATMLLKVNEVQAGGEATAASAVQILVFGRDSTKAATAISGCFNAALDATTTAPGTVAVFGNSSTTTPQRDATTGHLLHHSFNAYGGLVRWQARQGEEITIITATAPLGECSYSPYSGNVSGPISGHCLYELV
jgi:hypothetical protein